MVRRLSLGKNNHLTYISLALNPRYINKLILNLYVQAIAVDKEVLFKIYHSLSNTIVGVQSINHAG